MLWCVPAVHASARLSNNLQWHVGVHRFDHPRYAWRSHSPASLGAQMFTVDAAPGSPIKGKSLEGIS